MSYLSYIFSLKGGNRMAKVKDVAQYILEKQGDMTTIKLQKLVYYCQAWALVWTEAPLFEEKIEAWANGPVTPELFYPTVFGTYHHPDYF